MIWITAAGSGYDSGRKAGFEPELERQVMPCLISKVGPEFQFVTLLQNACIDHACFRQKLGVFQVHGTIPYKFRKSQIVDFEGAKSQPRKAARKELDQAAFVIFGNIGYSDVLEI